MRYRLVLIAGCCLVACEGKLEPVSSESDAQEPESSEQEPEPSDTPEDDAGAAGDISTDSEDALDETGSSDEEADDADADDNGVDDDGVDDGADDNPTVGAGGASANPSTGGGGAPSPSMTTAPAAGGAPGPDDVASDDSVGAGGAAVQDDGSLDDDGLGDTTDDATGVADDDLVADEVSTDDGSGDEGPADDSPQPESDAGASAGNTPPIRASLLAQDLINAGFDPLNLPLLLDEADQMAHVPLMHSFNASLGDCTSCHEADAAVWTAQKLITRHMWEDILSVLVMKDGSPLYCDSCHQGEVLFLDRSDPAALEVWMQENMVDKLARRDGQPHDCATCHGEPANYDLLTLWAQP
jgi:hypothetical protein